MSANCLVTKLKGVVNNDNLPYLDELRYNAPGAENLNFNIGPIAGGTVIFDVIDATIETTGGVQQTPPLNITSALTRVFKATGNTSVAIIKNKYQIGTLWFPTDLAFIEGCAGLIEISGSTNLMWGDISALEGKQHLEKFVVSNSTKIYGDIKVFGTCPSIKTLDFRYTTKITGDVESIIAGLIAGGRTSATSSSDGIAWTSLIGQELIKFNGTKPGTNGYFIWASNGNAGEYLVSYKKSSDNTLISSTTIKVESDGSWSRVS